MPQLPDRNNPRQERFFSASGFGEISVHQKAWVRDQLLPWQWEIVQVGPKVRISFKNSPLVTSFHQPAPPHKCSTAFKMTPQVWDRINNLWACGEQCISKPWHSSNGHLAPACLLHERKKKCPKNTFKETLLLAYLIILNSLSIWEWLYFVEM